MNIATIMKEIRSRSAKAGEGRFLVAVAGPPGAGKSTLAGRLVQALGQGARVVPMDGFHYDDVVLNARGIRHRKGAPDTFDVAGFRNLISRLRQEDEVAIPVFDRSMELSRAAGDIVMRDDRILVVEGNYLLLDESPWSDIAYDMSVWIDVPESELVRRLQKRWAKHGKTPAEAEAWIEGNDLPNVRRTILGSRRADMVVRGG